MTTRDETMFFGIVSKCATSQFRLMQTKITMRVNNAVLKGYISPKTLKVLGMCENENEIILSIGSGNKEVY